MKHLESVQPREHFKHTTYVVADILRIACSKCAVSLVFSCLINSTDLNALSDCSQSACLCCRSALNQKFAGTCLVTLSTPSHAWTRRHFSESTCAPHASSMLFLPAVRLGCRERYTRLYLSRGIRCIEKLIRILNGIA